MTAAPCPATGRSASSIKGEHPDRVGNKRPKNALSAFAALRGIAEGKKRKAATICLARRHLDVMYAVPRGSTSYHEKTGENG